MRSLFTIHGGEYLVGPYIEWMNDREIKNASRGCYLGSAGL